MYHLNRVLVVDDSKVVRELSEVILRPHCGEVLAASNLSQARQLLEEGEPSLLICDVILPDGNGFELVEELASASGPKPSVILVTASWKEEDAKRAVALGAIGYLAKPFSFRDIARALARPDHPSRQRSGHPAGRAVVLDKSLSGTRQLALRIFDLGHLGAFLESHAPIPLGTKLHLALELDGGVAEVQSEVVRIQRPSWAYPPGVAVAFKALDEASRKLIGDHTGLRQDEPS